MIEGIKTWFMSWFKWEYVYLTGKIGIILVAVFVFLLIIGALFYLSDELMMDFTVKHKKSRFGDLVDDIRTSLTNLVREIQKKME